MPLHEYECDACHHRFEVIRKFSDPPLDTCPKCGSPVRKLVAAPAFQFKGSGWYITDYAKKGKEDRASRTDTDKTSDAKTAEGSTEGTGTKSETKAETKTETSPTTEKKPTTESSN